MIKLIVIGKIKEKYLVNMIEDYYKRINKYHKLEIIELPDNNPKLEAERILKRINKNDINISLDLKGEEYDSIKFSKLIEESLMKYSNINFIIGGSLGLFEEVLKKSNKIISFSKLTFPHGMFRAILLEQIYRGFKIMNNEKYHK
ncbi:MAG: 23S rRNA (pseudouridine(1915)-N(3))-methyltransferase RlmH [Bacilli bacterium]|nr:23S rRNA (pseudouridine(1915)-N(3))-methyltransferase RlmH [Bacilli bacterium]